MGFIVRVTIIENEAEANGSVNGICMFHPDMDAHLLRAEMARADCIELRVTDCEPNKIHTCFQRDLATWKSRGLGFRTLEVFADSARTKECLMFVHEVKRKM